MNDAEKAADQISAFQKIWTDTFAKLMQSAILPGQPFPPPEMARHMRGAVFDALTQSWDEFMRSPQFLQTMKQWMDQAIKFRKMSNDFMSKVRTELQAPTRDDVEAVAFAVRGIEKRMEALSNELSEIKSAVSGQKKPRSPQTSKSRRNGRTRPARRAAGGLAHPSATAQSP